MVLLDIRRPTLKPQFTWIRRRARSWNQQEYLRIKPLVGRGTTDSNPLRSVERESVCRQNLRRGTQLHSRVAKNSKKQMIPQHVACRSKSNLVAEYDYKDRRGQPWRMPAGGCANGSLIVLRQDENRVRPDAYIGLKRHSVSRATAR